MTENCMKIWEEEKTELLTLETMKSLIEDDYNGSFEDRFWKRRSLGSRKGRDSYRNYRRMPRDKKRLCSNRIQFKGSGRWYGHDGKYFDHDSFLYEFGGESRNYAKRNIVYCAESRKNKILFESEKKANDFIRYNSETIENENGYAPVRAYYCEICGGWHLTSLEENPYRRGNSWARWALKEKQVIDEQDAALKAGKNAKKNNASTPALIAVCEDKQENAAEITKEIKALFYEEMETFLASYRNKDLATCKAIHSRLCSVFDSVDTEIKDIQKMKQRLQQAKTENIDKLEREFLEEQKRKEAEIAEEKKLIWSIQCIIREDYDRFKHAFALRKKGECKAIVDKITTALAMFPLDKPFLKAVRKKANEMTLKLLSLEEAPAARIQNKNGIEFRTLELSA